MYFGDLAVEPGRLSLVDEEYLNQAHLWSFSDLRRGARMSLLEFEKERSENR